MGLMCKVVSKTLQGTAAFLIAGCAVSDDFKGEVDRNLVAPLRNYSYTLSDFWHFRTQEDLQLYGGQILRGYKNFGHYVMTFGDKIE